MLFYPFLALCVSVPSLHRCAGFLFVVWSWLMRFVVFYHVNLKGLHRVPKIQGIYMANHASYLDIFLMPSLLGTTKVKFMGKSDILSYPLLQRYFKGYHIPVFRDNKLKAAKSLIQAKRAYEAGWSIIIFPEGGIPDSDKPNMLPFKDGAFRLAKEVGAPIIPLTFENNHLLFSDPMDWFGYCRPGISDVYVHEPIRAEEVLESSTEDMRNRCYQLIREPLVQRFPERMHD